MREIFWESIALPIKNIQMENKMLTIKTENPKDINTIYEINKRALGTETETKMVDAGIR